MDLKQYEPIIGMEIHVELATVSKMFCGCKNDPFFAEKPNIHTCPVCLGYPGGLPVANKKAIEWTIKLGFALGCDISELSKFDRKHYFYPDLAKGYQISQYDMPFCKNGKLKTSKGIVRINRVHLEEDTGKLLHQTVEGKKKTLIDFNRSGVPLIEIVTEPDIHSGDQAKEFLKHLHQIIQYLDISSADMEKGSMRLEPNISVRKISKGKDDGIRLLPPYKVEVKNINSFNFVKKAIDFEIERQIEIIEKGEIPSQETRGYNEDKGITFSQRAKEGAVDYRYFPEPDIPPIRLTKKTITELKQTLPELPTDKKNRFIKEYGLADPEAIQIIETRARADYFESCIALCESESKYKAITPKKIANTIINKKVDGTTSSPHDLLEKISIQSESSNVNPEDVAHAISSVLHNQEKAVNDYKNGKVTVVMYLVGQVKRELQGKGDAKAIEEELKRRMNGK